MEIDVGHLRQQMGELLRSIEALNNVIELRERQAHKLHELMRSDMAMLRQDQRDLEEKLDCVICVMQHDLEALRTASSENAFSVHTLVTAVQDLRDPVAEIVALRARAAGAILGVGLLGSAMLWLAEPVYRWVLEHSYLKQ